MGKLDLKVEKKKKNQTEAFVPVLGVPGEEELAVVPLGFAEVAGSDSTWRANLPTGTRGSIGSRSTQRGGGERMRTVQTEGRDSGGPHLAAPAAPVWAATAGTGQATGAGGLASKRAAGAATAAGCPAATRATNFRGSKSIHMMHLGKIMFTCVKKNSGQGKSTDSTPSLE